MSDHSHQQNRFDDSPYVIDQIHKLNRENATQSSEFTDLKSHVDGQFSSIASCLSRLETKIDRLETKTDTQSEYINKTKGGLKVSAYVLTTLLAVLGVSVAIWNIVFGS